MTLCQAIKIVNNRGRTPWLDWLVIKIKNNYYIKTNHHLNKEDVVVYNTKKFKINEKM